MISRFTTSSLALLAALALATNVSAQAAAAPAVPSGPSIPGVCTISLQQVVKTSTVGRYVAQRLQDLGNVVKAELQPEGTQLNTDVRAFEAKRTTLAAATAQSQADALQARVNSFQQKQELRGRELQETEQKALGRIVQEIDPIERQLYVEHRCSILLNKDSAVLVSNPEMDLSTQAVASLNSRIQQFAFEREHLDTTAAGQR